MVIKKAVRRLVETSRSVFQQCALPNGAIVAARPDLPDYPADVQSYGFVWIRDAAFVCVAADLIHEHELPERFFRWVWEQAERTRDGLLVNAYFPNGVAAGVIVRGRPPGVPGAVFTLPLSAQIQWDAVGTLLWAIAEHKRRMRQLSATNYRLSAHLAKIIVNSWTGTHFRQPNWDLWEAQLTDPQRSENHTYSLAMAIRGLEEADRLLKPDRRRQRTIASLRRRLESAYDHRRRTFLRRFGRRSSDPTPDVSLLGLVFPAQQVAAQDPRMVATLDRVLTRCRGRLGGLRRFLGDWYTGAIARGRLQSGEAGEWPWLSAWASIVFVEQGNDRAALREFRWILKQSRGQPLPEQYHKGKTPSVTGLAVSHAFALFAAEKLGLL